MISSGEKLTIFLSLPFLQQHKMMLICIAAAILAGTALVLLALFLKKSDRAKRRIPSGQIVDFDTAELPVITDDMCSADCFQVKEDITYIGSAQNGEQI